MSLSSSRSTIHLFQSNHCHSKYMPAFSPSILQSLFCGILLKEGLERSSLQQSPTQHLTRTATIPILGPPKPKNSMGQGRDCISCVRTSIFWKSNTVVSLLLEKAFCQSKIDGSPIHSSSVYASCINFTVSAADFFNRHQNFIPLLCSFFISVFEISKFARCNKNNLYKNCSNLAMKKSDNEVKHQPLT